MPLPNNRRRTLSISEILRNNRNNETEAAQRTDHVAPTQQNTDIHRHPRLFSWRSRPLPRAQTRVGSPNVPTGAMNARSRILSEGPPAHTLTQVVDIPNQETETAQHATYTSFHNDAVIAHHLSNLHIPAAIMRTQAASVPDDDASVQQIVDDLDGTTINSAVGLQGEIIADDIAPGLRSEVLIIDNGVARTLNDAEATVMDEFVHNDDNPRDSFASTPAFDVLTYDTVDGAARTLTEADRNIMRIFEDDEPYTHNYGFRVEHFGGSGNDLERFGILPHEDLPNHQPTRFDVNVAEALRTMALNYYPPGPFEPPARVHENGRPTYNDEDLWNVNYDDTIMEGIRPTAARALLTWTMQHLEPLALTQLNYPLESDCPICHDPFILDDPQHTPVLVKDIEGCAGHVFCNACITNWLTSGQENANTCPMCRSELMELDADGNLLPPFEHVEQEDESIEEVRDGLSSIAMSSTASEGLHTVPEAMIEERSRTWHTLTQAEREAEETQDVVRHHQPDEQPSRPTWRFLDEDTTARMSWSVQILAVVVLGIVFLRYILDECILVWNEYQRFVLGILVGAVTGLWLGRRGSR